MTGPSSDCLEVVPGDLRRDRSPLSRPWGHYRVHERCSGQGAALAWTVRHGGLCHFVVRKAHRCRRCPRLTASSAGSHSAWAEGARELGISSALLSSDRGHAAARQRGA